MATNARTWSLLFLCAGLCWARQPEAANGSETDDDADDGGHADPPVTLFTHRQRLAYLLPRADPAWVLSSLALRSGRGDAAVLALSYGQSPSRLRTFEAATGTLRSEYTHMPVYEARGVCVVGGYVVQAARAQGHLLFLREGSEGMEMAFRLELPLRPVAGIAYDGRGRLFVSDNTSTLHMVDIAGSKALQTARLVYAGNVSVVRLGVAVQGLADIEHIGGNLWAVSGSTLVRVDPGSGVVHAEVDLADLERLESGRLSAVAFDPFAARLFVAGERWRHVYWIEICIAKDSGTTCGPPALPRGAGDDKDSGINKVALWAPFVVGCLLLLAFVTQVFHKDSL
eukprot:m51a1_g8155 putative C-tail anchored protein (341) ;mRNA; r:58758-59913